MALRITLILLIITPPALCHAFCGFFVSSADSQLYNNASQVVLMRNGSKTAMSISNNYVGPVRDFAMVVPVPVILKRSQIKTLLHDVFERIDQFSAPRLVEYWERDPCAERAYRFLGSDAYDGGASARAGGSDRAGGARSLGVQVEAEFTVGEYSIVILSAQEANGLERWLRENQYTIPSGAAQALAPYISAGMKFFVAKVNIKKVKRDKDGVVKLSPLRFDFESKQLRLPVRLGLLNAQGKQDLLIYILDPAHRYEAANYPNVLIPTNLEVEGSVKPRFGDFYTQLFDRTLAEAGGRAVVTEYSWQTSQCDPCPTPPLGTQTMLTLGGDYVSGPGELLTTTQIRPQISIQKIKYTWTEAPTRTSFERLKSRIRSRKRLLVRCVRGHARTMFESARARLEGLVIDLRITKRGKRISTKIKARRGEIPKEIKSCLESTVKYPIGRRLRDFTEFSKIVIPLKIKVKAIKQSAYHANSFGSWVLTRLHTRYDRDTLSEDLVFTPAPAISGGRGWNGENIKGTQVISGSGVNTFQGRYIIRHYWRGETQCKTPHFNDWLGQRSDARSQTATDDVIMGVKQNARISRETFKLDQVIRSAMPQWGIEAKPRPQR